MLAKYGISQEQMYADAEQAFKDFEQSGDTEELDICLDNIVSGDFVQDMDKFLDTLENTNIDNASTIIKKTLKHIKTVWGFK